MVSLHHIRRRASLVRGVLAIFAIAWLQLAVVPCAMAEMGASPSMASMAIDVSVSRPEADAPHHQHVPYHEDGSHHQIDAAIDVEPQHDCIYCLPGDHDGIDAFHSGCVYPHVMKPDSPSSQPQTSAMDLLPGIVVDSWASNSLLAFEDPALSCYVLPPRPRPLRLTQGVQLK